MQQFKKKEPRHLTKVVIDLPLVTPVPVINDFGQYLKD